MNPKNSKKSPIHENADGNITCDFGDGDISRSRSFLSNTCTTGANGRRTTEDSTTTEDSHVDLLNLIVDNILSVATVTSAIQGSNVDTLSGYLEEWGVPMRHDSYTQDIYI